jgi:hypothetical protein
VLVLGGASHTSFTALSAYMSPLRRQLTGDDGSQAQVAATTGDLIAAFVAAPLTGPGDSMAAVLARHPTVRREQGYAAGGRRLNWGVALGVAGTERAAGL